MTKHQYGDLLRYTEEQDPRRSYLFMYVQSARGGTNSIVQVIKCPRQDDLWEPGMIITAGQYEMERADDD